MEQYILWYMLQLKAWIKRKTSWLMTIGVLTIVILISQIQLPSADNIKAGICISNGNYAEKMLDALENMNSTFVFEVYEDSEELKEKIVSGKLECGFVLDTDFEKLVSESDLKNSITYICTPLTTKGEIMKETVYAAFLQVYGEIILVESEEEIYGYESEEITEQLLEKYQYYLENSRLLNMRTETVNVEIKQQERETRVLTVQGLAAVLIFLIIWLECGRKFEKGATNVYAALDLKNRNIFEFSGYLAVATVPSILLLFIILLSGMSRNALIEIAAMAFFVILCSFWVLILGKCFKNSTTFISWATTLVMIQVLICPVFVDLAEYFPALGIIRMLFPVGWYLAF